MAKIRFMGTKLLMALLPLILISLFQNCSSPGSSSRGGTGTDGLRFFAYSLCANNQVGISATVAMSKDHSSAMFLRQNCQDLATPQPISPSSITFVSQDNTVFTLNGQVYDQQTGFSGQRVTTEVCQSSGATPSVQALIWNVQGNAASLFGSVTLSDGTGTGTLTVQNPSSSTPLDFATAPAQSSQFNLSLTNASSGTLSYTLNGGRQVSIPNMTCSTQPIPSSTIFFRSRSATYSNTNNSITIDTPAGIQSGDVMIATVFGEYTSSICPNTVTPPAGWVQIRSDVMTDVDCNEQTLFYKVATGTEPANYTFTLQSSVGYITQFRAAIVGYSGVKTAAPIDAQACSHGTVQTASAPSITTTNNNATLIFTIYQNTSHGYLPQTPPSLVQRIGDTDNSSYFNYIYDGNVPVAGPTGTIPEMIASGDDWIACSLALTPGP